MDVFHPHALSTPSGTIATELAMKALDSRLTVYAGAGLSAAPPTGLPGAAGLARRVADALDHLVAMDGIDRSDLLAVADLVANQPRGLQLLRKTVLDVADLLGAPTNYGHQVIALLICEGAITALQTNYDDCIERAAQPERLAAVRTPDELLHGPTTAVLKAHGCATLPPTMLITSDDLQDVPFWADATVSARLSRDHVAFIGIGSVADYVQASLAKVLQATGQDHITLVDPALSGWDDEPTPGWKKFLPELPPDQRVAEDASAFCDDLLRAYLAPTLQAVRQLVSGFQPDHNQRIGVEKVLGALENTNAVFTLRWLRDASFCLPPGTTALTSTSIYLLIAAGSVFGDGWSPTARPNGILRATREPRAEDNVPAEVPVFLLAVQKACPGSIAANEAKRRLVEARTSQSLIGPADVVVLVGGHAGSLGLEEVQVERGASLNDVIQAAEDILGGTPTNLISSVDADHLIDGPLSGRMLLVNAELICDVAAAP